MGREGGWLRLQHPRLPSRWGGGCHPSPKRHLRFRPFRSQTSAVQTPEAGTISKVSLADRTSHRNENRVYVPTYEKVLVHPIICT